MTVALINYFQSSPRERDAARQIDYMSHLDFMAGEVIFTTDVADLFVINAFE